MGKILTKKEVLFERDEKEQIIPIEAELIVDADNIYQKKYAGRNIKLTPIPRGKLRRIFAEIRKGDADSETESDNTVVKEHCIEPAFTDTDLLTDMPGLIASIVNTILYHSGLDTTKGMTNKKSLEKKEDEFSKN